MSWKKRNFITTSETIATYSGYFFSIQIHQYKENVHQWPLFTNSQKALFSTTEFSVNTNSSYTLCTKTLLLRTFLNCCCSCYMKSLYKLQLDLGLHTNLIFGASDIGGDSTLLLFASHLPLSTAMVGAHRWPVHGGCSVILWRRRQHISKGDIHSLHTKLWGSRLMYFLHFCRGFSGVCLWSYCVNQLAVLFW